MSTLVVPRAWLPDEQEPFQITGLADAFDLAITLADDQPVARVLVLLDRHRRVLAMLEDPDHRVLCHPARADGPGLVRPVVATLLYSPAELALGAPPTGEDRRWFAVLRELQAADTVELIDWIQIDAGRELLRSMATTEKCV